MLYYFENVDSKKIIKGIISIIVTGVFFIISLSPDKFKEISTIWQITIFTFLAISNLFAAPVIDEFSYLKVIEKLKAEKNTLQKIMKSSKTEVEDLHKLIARYINHSIYYKNNIIEKLDINDEFLCIMKSSEGFGDIWDELEQKEMLPFTKVLSELPGSVRPFERDGLFIIPIKNLDDFNKKDIRKFINKKIIPKVKTERKKYIKNIPDHLKDRIDKFSFKYIAFVLRKNSLDYDSENRKFNDAFSVFIVSNQAQRTVASIANELSGFITGKEIFSLVDWEAFVDDLNKEQTELVIEFHSKLNAEFKRNKIFNLVDLSKRDVENIQNIVLKVFGNKTSNIKSKNLAIKIINGSQKTVKILRNAGALI